MDDKSLLLYVDKLQRENAEDLAFYPLTTLEEAIASGHVVFCKENDEVAGYLWFGALRGGHDVIIYQACVDYDARRRHLGHQMVSELAGFSRASGCVGIRLRCASSSESNEFWQAAGFYCTRVSDGGKKRGRKLNHYRTDLSTPLFTLPPVDPSDAPIDLTAYNKSKRMEEKMPSRFSRTHY